MGKAFSSLFSRLCVTIISQKSNNAETEYECPGFSDHTGRHVGGMYYFGCYNTASTLKSEKPLFHATRQHSGISKGSNGVCGVKICLH